MYRSLTTILILMFLGLSGCDNTPSVSLYSVNGISPSLVETGNIIKISGEGFVEGSVTVTIKGNFKADRPVAKKYKQIVLKGKAVSENEIQIAVTPYIMKRLTAEPVEFSGNIVVSFPTALKESVVRLEAVSPKVDLQFIPLGGGVKMQAENIQESRSILKMTGVFISKSDKKGNIEVDKVSTGSLAYLNGVAPGDRLISVDSFPVANISEIAGISLKESHTFEYISTSGNIKKIEGKIGEATPFQQDEFVAVLLTSLALGLFLALILPTYIKSAGIPKKQLSNLIGNISGAILSTVLILFAVAAILLNNIQLKATIGLLLVVLAIGLIFLFFNSQNFIAKLLTFIIQISAIFLVVASGTYFSGSPGIIDVVNSQSGAHFAFYMWRNPFVMITGVLAVSVLWPKALADSNSSTWTTIIAWVMTGAGAMAVTAFFLGGWVLPGEVYTLDWSKPSLLLQGIMVFLVKAWLVILAARLMAGAADFDRRFKKPANTSYISRWVLMLMFAAGASVFETITMPSGLIFAEQVISAGIFFSLLSLLVFSKVIIFYPKPSKKTIQSIF